jgi:MSHA pilin protein MshD
VSDYSGASIAPITDIAGGGVPGLAGYSASITVTPAALGGIPATELFLIDVTVNGPRNESFTLSGMRARYAPRATP